MNGIKHLITAALKCLSSKGTIQSCCSLLFVFMAAIASAVFSLVGGSILSDDLLLLEGVALRV